MKIKEYLDEKHMQEDSPQAWEAYCKRSENDHLQLCETYHAISRLLSVASGHKVQAYINSTETRVTVYCDNNDLLSVNVSEDSPLALIGDVVPRALRRLY